MSDIFTQLRAYLWDALAEEYGRKAISDMSTSLVVTLPASWPCTGIEDVGQALNRSDFSNGNKNMKIWITSEIEALAMSTIKQVIKDFSLVGNHFIPLALTSPSSILIARNSFLITWVRARYY
ncbi:hypothetical protein B0T26DRAFT_152080 [Lasiosphaeria miniovina]|uniref:Uncharacterized protein n=1 Tax=Lasiosphaeria miniovina TaxID=1954250 RepID=A0AA40B5M8_9PEZI|nr:uncharacterized protein B0T26DRAFT_152080 [Lasiosphaeria miniovina]KAK0727967.1 hypothetical protein B0T26DRAFT_152080 [Lasiosphaeria miniovina]